MLFSVPTTVAGCSVKRLIHPTVLCSGPVGLIRRASVASGTECRMRRKTPYPAYGSVLGSCRPDKTRQRRIRQKTATNTTNTASPGIKFMRKK
ncbi:ribonucleoside diphosphage reductase 1, beta subunit, B2 [Escherichia coli H386]|uniref:Ribonucleoside diphosphage reductase 1, beta subunit, B2 n=1 Tax=Escherichia coli H386 TaxID=656397 RepID=A0A1X3JDQ5_ECOLX|nr:ribonucleoside diphosphage reductase 1, beta subunit, B2 [Escherichia coli H386]